MRRTSNLAEQISAEQEVRIMLVKKPVVRDPLDELFFRKPIRRHIQDFSAVICIALCLAGSYLLFKQRAIEISLVLALAGISFCYLGYRTPARLEKIWRGWLSIGNGIGAVVTALLLGTMWLGMFIPVALSLKVARKDVMNMSFREARQTYWEDRNPASDDFKLLERQY